MTDENKPPQTINIEAIIDIASGNSLAHALPSRIDSTEIGSYVLQAKAFKSMDELNAWLEDEGNLHMIVARDFSHGEVLVWFYTIELEDAVDGDGGNDSEDQPERGSQFKPPKA